MSGAFVIGGQLGFVSLKTPEIINIYILTKVIAGFSALILALYLTREPKKIFINNENAIVN